MVVVGGAEKLLQWRKKVTLLLEDTEGMPSMPKGCWWSVVAGVAKRQSCCWSKIVSGSYEEEDWDLY